MSSGSTGTQRSAPVTRSLHPTLTTVLFAAVAVAIGIWCLIWMTTDQSHTKPPELKVVSPPRELAKKQDTGEKQETGETVTGGTIVPQEPPEALALRKNEFFAAKRQLDRIRERIDGMRDAVKRCDELLSNEDGKRVASSPELIEQYSAIRSLIQLDDLERWSAELANLESAVTLEPGADERAPDEPAWQNLEKETATAFFRVRKVAQMLDYLVSQAPAAAPEAATLKDAFERLEGERSAELARRLADTRKEIQDELEAETKKFDEQITSMEVEIKRLHAKAAVDEEADRIKRIEFERQHEVNVRKQEIELEKLRKQFELEYPRFEKYLIPFTSHGYTQPRGASYVQSTNKGPVSFARLVGSGTLQEGRALDLFNMTVSRNGDRELGAFPPYSHDKLSRQTIDTLDSIQTFLRIYGPIMVEKKYLAP
jgi:hypothetical protein